MGTKSHVDLCMFVQILEIAQEDIPDVLLPALLSRDVRRINGKLLELGHDPRTEFVDSATNLHESIHIVQAVIYPFLRWYSVLTFQQVTQIFKIIPAVSEMRRSGAIDNYVVPAFHFMDINFNIIDLRKKFLFWTYKWELGLSAADDELNGKTTLIRINIVDLLENAASLIQFKISTGVDFPTWREFERWCKRNPSYNRVIEFVGRFLGDYDLGVRIFLSLIQVAFETNKPVEAFTRFLGGFKYNLDHKYYKDFIAQQEPCRWIELFESYFDKISLVEAEYGDLLSKKFFRLDRYDTSNFRLGGQLGHPILGALTKKWGELEKNDASYRYAFTAPNGYAHLINELSSLFSAPLAVLKFNIDGQTIALMSGDLNATGVASWTDTMGEADIKGALTDFFNIFGVTRRFANALMDEDFRLCFHSTCPLYHANFCNMWIFIPRAFDKCGFEGRIKYVLDNYSGGRAPNVQLVIGGDRGDG